MRVAVGLGNDHLTLPVGIGADLFAFGTALRTQFIGHLLSFGLHAAVDRVGDVGDEVHSLDPDVHDLDTEGLGVIRQAGLDVVHHLLALGGQHTLHVALGHFFVEGGLHHG